ncbi:MAG: hypothetical protein DMG98_20340 [Acidobacteria bacterium]|nr:MAG: hypothetical protein DMG98_20340 [Acidobacteriota bacterium]
MNEIYVVGGRFRGNMFRKLEEWQSCKEARIIQLDPTTKTSRSCVEYVSPPHVCPEELPAILFKSATLRGNKLYACTSTEILVYEVPSFCQASYISLPCFNDLHHVYPSAEGTLLAAVTGLDMVVEITMEGKVLREWSVLGEDPWVRFSREIDYRRVPTTKPHRSHPNHVFQLQDEIWVTRLQQRDAISLTRPGRRIEIAVQRPHDGYVFGDSIYFTTVDGHIVIADRKRLQIKKVYDLNQMGSSGQILGWCRGLLPLDENRLWVGFTRVRPTRFQENLAWIANQAQRHRPSHIALYDLGRGACLEEIEMEPHGIGIVFTLFQIQPRPGASGCQAPRDGEIAGEFDAFGRWDTAR